MNAIPSCPCCLLRLHLLRSLRLWRRRLLLILPLILLVLLPVLCRKCSFEGTPPPWGHNFTNI